MASRSKHERQPERGGDTMEAIKPLIVLGLFATILYGAYSVVQKGPSPSVQADGTEAPAFVAPDVDMPAAPSAVAATPPAAATASARAQAPASAAAPSAPLALAPAAVAAVAVPPAAVVAASPVPPAALAVTAAAAPVIPTVAAAAPATPAAAPPSPASPVYLAAQSAPPPAQEDVAAPPPGADRPERLATLAATAPAASLPPQMPPTVAAPPSSNAFATAWADAHTKLAAGRYAEALTALSVWYDDPSLGLEESHRLEDLLGQLAGTVIYSQQNLLLPPHVVAPGETLQTIAASLGMSWQLLGKINAITDPSQLAPGEHLKVIRGPFDAVLSVSRRRVSLQLRGAYAGSFPVVVGRQFLPRVGSTLAVVEVRRDSSTPGRGFDPAAVFRQGVVLADGMVIESAPDPNTVADDAAPGSLIVSERDLAELADILGPGSSVLIRQ